MHSLMLPTTLELEPAVRHPNVPGLWDTVAKRVVLFGALVPLAPEEPLDTKVDPLPVTVLRVCQARSAGPFASLGLVDDEEEMARRLEELPQPKWSWWLILKEALWGLNDAEYEDMYPWASLTIDD